MPDLVSNNIPDLVTDTMIAEMKPLKPGGPNYITAVEVSRQLGVSRATIYNLCEKRLLGHIRVGDSIKFTQSHVDDFLVANTVTPIKPAA